MRSLVTGGGGFVGRFIVRQLLERGEKVRVLGRRDYPFLREIGAECVVGDVTDVAATAAAVRGCECVYHVAALPGVWGSLETYRAVNVLGTRNVLNACVAATVDRLVYTSSPSVVFDGQDHRNADESLPYPDDYLCHYPRTKAEAEQLVLSATRETTVKAVALRPHLVFGPEDNSLTPRVHQRARDGRLRVVGDGRSEVSVSYVENVAAAHLQAADELAGQGRCRGRAYFVNEPAPVAVGDWVNQILAFGGLPPCEKFIPLPAAYAVGATLETAYRLARRTTEPPMTRFVALQLGRTHTYDTSAAVRDFGYRPVVDWSDALARTTAYFSRPDAAPNS